MDASIELQRQWPNKFHAMPSFVVVRDPIERFLSAYNYVSNGGNGGDIDRQCARRLNNQIKKNHKNHRDEHIVQT